MEKYVEVVASYGRSYKTAKAAKEDWEANKDFTVAATGQQINKADAVNYGVVQVNIRYNENRGLTAVKIKR